MTTKNEHIRKWAEIVERQETEEKGQLLCEMSRVATFDGYNLIVWPDDKGQIPHFHVSRGNPVHPDFDCCIKYLTAEYFPHSGHVDRLSRNELKDLVKLLQSKDKAAGEEYTVWKTLINHWNTNNDRRMVPWNTEMPDYIHIV